MWTEKENELIEKRKKDEEEKQRHMHRSFFSIFYRAGGLDSLCLSLLSVHVYILIVSRPRTLTGISLSPFQLSSVAFWCFFWNGFPTRTRSLCVFFLPLFFLLFPPPFSSCSSFFFYFFIFLLSFSIILLHCSLATHHLTLSCVLLAAPFSGVYQLSSLSRLPLLLVVSLFLFFFSLMRSSYAVLS